MLEVEGEPPRLIYREVTGELAKCIQKEDVERIMKQYHDCHGHFAKDMTLRMLRGKYFWPTRCKDVALYVSSCDACQRFGSLKTMPRKLRTILSIQPMDMMGIDFIGPISPMSRNGFRYIIVAVDYFSRFLFTAATEKANGKTVRDFVAQRITTNMEWPASVYCDNVSYFVKGVFPEDLKARGVKLFAAPITHPASIDLAERYVNLTLTALRTLLRRPNADGRGTMPLNC